MATRAQVKALLDSMNAAVKADIDATLPASVSIIGGDTTPIPLKWIIELDGGGSLSSATTLATAIIGNLNSQSRSYTLFYARRETDNERFVLISSPPAVYKITNI